MEVESETNTPSSRGRELLPERDVGVLHGGIRVVDRPHTHLSDDPAFREIVARALLKITLDLNALPDHVVCEVVFEEVVGMARFVATQPGDEIVYARRYHRRGPSRFVKYREPLPTNIMTIVLLRKKDAPVPTYLLITAHTGPKAAYEPWDQHATATDRDFWRNHALVYSPDDIMPDSEVSEREFFRPSSTRQDHR